jgi:hypothetical protein
LSQELGSEQNEAGCAITDALLVRSHSLDKQSRGWVVQR